MPPSSKTQHRTFPNMALPFVTNTSVTSANPQYVAGSNVLTSIKGLSERRPGWPTALENTPVTLGAGETIQNIALWSKWSGQYYAMYFTVDATQSYIYKLAIGVNATAVKIFTSSSTTAFTWNTANDVIYMGNGTDMVKFRATSTADTAVYKWGIAAPAAAPTLSTGGTGINAQTGYYYVYTYWNDNTGHESSPSPLSACTGTFTNKTVTVTYTDGDDSGTGITNQITHVKIYRTTDGGSSNTTAMQLVVKKAVGSTTYADSTLDASLASEYAPERYRNDRPPASLVGAYSQGRIALFVNSSVWLTGYELVSKGVPEESVFGGTLGVLGGGDVFNYDKPVNGVVYQDEGLAVFMPLRIDAITGDSADTFRRSNLLRGRGISHNRNVANFGSDVVWFDTSGQLWHSKLGEIGQDIRPTIQGINQASSMVAIHVSGVYHHVYLMDGANGIVYAFDLDTQIWMPPWNIGTTIGCIVSGETATGTVSCVLSRNGTKALSQSKSSYSDDGSTYTASATTGLTHISQAPSNPEWRGVVDNIEVKTNAVLPTTLKLLLDDDPQQATFVDISVGARNIDDAVQGTYLRQRRYPVGTLMEDSSKSCKGRFASVQINWAAAATNFTVEFLDIGYYPHGV